MRRIAFILMMLLAVPVAAVEPEEMLADPVLEARAQALDHELRCVKCQSESIASSNSDWARDARVLVRELLTEGMSDEEVVDFFVARYGDFVKMRPDADGANLILWASGPLMLLIAGGLAFAFLRGRARATPQQAGALSEDEEARLRRILEE
ncbi:cytochrome c-type biogenesis protein [Pseudaestuariivita atlantica]|uniref:Cytochrome c-type biogenesis protein n=1 Tax=Pseudaestuariivita atlantica TaxID=1317121 RepID=A0A0L1JMQ5_9RHOB|nr:cytochrome c-type biogenesis protein [Pseudaestuariivita atlantica]KNG92987.1 cytochrome C biogenesis protein CcdA [Pseudaestuariivita atlantica]